MRSLVFALVTARVFPFILLLIFLKNTLICLVRLNYCDSWVQLGLMHILKYISLMLLMQVFNRRHEDYKAGGKVKGTRSFYVYNFPISFSPFRKCCLNVCQLTNFENVLFLCWFSLVPSPFSSLSKGLYPNWLLCLLFQLSCRRFSFPSTVWSIFRGTTRHNYGSAD